MKQILWFLIAALSIGSMALAQGRGGQAQSPAAVRPPQTVTPQSYPADQVQVGQVRFVSQCALCHGRDAAGSDTGPDLTRSKLVAEDNRGDKITPLVRAGRPEKGMPAFDVSDVDAGALVAYIHDQKAKMEALGGGRRSVDVTDLQTGNAGNGQRYFSTNCSQCHSATGDLAGIATRFQGLPLLQRMLYPTSGRPAPAPPKATVTLSSGEAVTGPVVSRDEFAIAITDPAGTRRDFELKDVKVVLDEPLNAHYEQLGKYTDADMHDVFAFLQTLK